MWQSCSVSRRSGPACGWPVRPECPAVQPPLAGSCYFHLHPVAEGLVTLPEHYAHSSAHAEGRLKMFYDER